MSSKVYSHVSSGGSCSDESGEQPAARRLTPSPSGGFVVQVPKDQIFRVPPPENAHRYKLYTRKAKKGGTRRRVCFCVTCRCISITAVLLLALVLSAAVSAAALYLVYRPRLPAFQVNGLTFQGANLSAASIVVLARNPNTKLGLAYEHGGELRALHYGALLGAAPWPPFRLLPGDERGVRLALQHGAAGVAQRMKAEGRTAKVEIRVPAKVIAGTLEMSLGKVKVTCDVKVDSEGKVVSSTCQVKLELST